MLNRTRYCSVIVSKCNKSIQIRTGIKNEIFAQYKSVDDDDYFVFIARFLFISWVYLVSIAVKRITIQSNEIRPQYNTLCCENDSPRDISVECKIIAHEIAHCRLKDFFFTIVGISMSIGRRQ